MTKYDRIEIVRQWRAEQFQFPEIVVNGQRLGQLLTENYKLSTYESNQRWGLKYPEAIAAQCLLATKPDFNSGRYAILIVCEICGDPWCGSYAARIEQYNTHYVWFDLLREPVIEGDEESMYRTAISNQRFYFERQYYEDCSAPFLGSTTRRSPGAT